MMKPNIRGFGRERKGGLFQHGTSLNGRETRGKASVSAHVAQPDSLGAA